MTRFISYYNSNDDTCSFIDIATISVLLRCTSTIDVTAGIGTITSTINIYRTVDYYKNMTRILSYYNSNDDTCSFIDVATISVLLRCTSTIHVTAVYYKITTRDISYYYCYDHIIPPSVIVYSRMYVVLIESVEIRTTKCTCVIVVLSISFVIRTTLCTCETYFTYYYYYRD